MRSLASLLMVVVALLALPGCALFKKSGDAKPAAGGDGPSPAKFPTANDPLFNGGGAAQASSSAVIAGRVFDNYSKPPANTSIQLVSMDAKDGEPKEVNVSPDGYFIIQGLKAGGSYKLVARGKSGERTVAGITQTRAPNVTVVIQVREDFVNAGTPDVPGSPAFGDKATKTSGASAQGPFPAVGQGGSRTGDDLQLPAVSVPAPGPSAASSMQPSQGWVPGPGVASDKSTTLPFLDVPNPTVKPAPAPLVIPNAEPVPKTDPQLPPVSPPPNSSALDNRAAAAIPVPSCVWTGGHLEDFALNDVNGTPWQFKRDRRGKLALIDFWYTTCTPCLVTMPILKSIQAKYSPQGLEVIGVAVEAGDNPREVATRVDRVARSKQVNYRQLVSISGKCPLCAQGMIDAFPTLVLVDRAGTVVWRHIGALDAYKLNELHSAIRRYLNAP